MQAFDVSRFGASAALAIDGAGRVVAWNAGAARLLGRPESQALGRPCWELVRGRDAYGNRFCHERCAVRCMVHRGEVVARFAITAASPSPRGQTLSVATALILGGQAGGGTLVHVLHPIGDDVRPPFPITSSALTTREKQILGLVAAGLQNKEIAQQAGISLATVRNHVHNLLDKLGLHSKLEAVSLAFRSGWIEGATRGPLASFLHLRSTGGGDDGNRRGRGQATPG